MNFSIKLFILSIVLLLGIAYAQQSFTTTIPQQGISTARPILGIIGIAFVILGALAMYGYLINLILYAIEIDKRKMDIALPIVMIILGFLFGVFLPIFAYVESRTAKELGFFTGIYKTTYNIGKAGLVLILIGLIFFVLVILSPAL